jgi:hypothetical protein
VLQPKVPLAPLPLAVDEEVEEPLPAEAWMY